MLLRNRLALLSSAVVLLTALPVSAASIVYADLTSWLAATTTPTDISFSVLGLTPSGTLAFGTAGGLTVLGVQFTGIVPLGYNLQLFGQNQSSPYFDFGAPATLVISVNRTTASDTFLPYIHVVLPANTTAFSTNLATVSPNGLSFQVTLADGTSYTVGTPATRPNTGFIGVTSDAPISYVDFTVLGAAWNDGAYGLLANFKTGVNGAPQVPVDPGQVPEASTLLLIGGGLAFIGARFKNRFLQTMLPA